MVNLRIIISDDDTTTRILIRQFIEKLPYVTVVAEAANGEELVDFIIRERPHLVLADIKMPELNGMNAIKECLKLQPKLKFIFVTCYDEFAVEAFNIKAVDYVVKPILRLRLYEAIERAKSLIELEMNSDANIIHKSKQKIQVKINKSTYLISNDDILFIEKLGRKSAIHTVNQNVLETYDDIEGFQKIDLVKTHRSYLVNLSKISKITKTGETYQAYFGDYTKTAHIAKSKINDIQRLLR